MQSLRNPIRPVLFAAIVMILTGCEVLSLRTYPNDNLELKPEFPIGEFVTLENDPMITYRDGHQIGFNAPTEDAPDFLLNIYALENFRGICIKQTPIDPDALEAIETLNPGLAEHIEETIESAIIPWRFGAVEVYDDAFILLVPHQPAFSGMIQVMGIVWFKENLEDEYASTILVATPEELVALMDRAMPTNLFLPMVFVPAKVGESWTFDTDEDDMRTQVRSLYPALMDRLEEIERATDAYDD